MRRLEAQAMAARAADAHGDHVAQHHDTVQSYSWHSKALNQRLLNRAHSDQINHPSAAAKLDKLHSDLQTAISSAPAAHADMHVYSGVAPRYGEHLAGKQEGDVLTMRAHTSTSFNPEVAGKFAKGGRPTILHVAIKKGQKGILHAEHASLHPAERETIIGAGAKLRINKIIDDGPRRIISTELVD